jgi:hypothetical protein
MVDAASQRKKIAERARAFWEAWELAVPNIGAEANERNAQALQALAQAFADEHDRGEKTGAEVTAALEAALEGARAERARLDSWTDDFKRAVNAFQAKTPPVELVVGRDIGEKTAAAIAAALEPHSWQRVQEAEKCSESYGSSSPASGSPEPFPSSAYAPIAVPTGTPGARTSAVGSTAASSASAPVTPTSMTPNASAARFEPGDPRQLRKDPAISAFIDRHIMCSQGPRADLSGTWSIYKHASDCKHTYEDNVTAERDASRADVDEACEAAPFATEDEKRGQRIALAHHAYRTEGALLRRAVGIVQDLQRLESECHAVLDAYGGAELEPSPLAAEALRTARRLDELEGRRYFRACAITMIDGGICALPKGHPGPCGAVP